MAVFVLVHGAYQGGWCWRKITPLLEADGHAVYTPTLTGLGERAHLLSPIVNLSTHIQDIANVLFYQDLHDVILVGHSYAGMVIAGVAESVPERIGRLIYLDVGAFPEDGRSYFDVLSPELGELWRANTVELRGTRVYPNSSAHWELFLTACQVTEPADVAWMMPRLTPQPLAAMEEQIQLTSGHKMNIPSSYVLCCDGLQDEAAARELFKSKAVDRGWGFFEIQSDHEAMITGPRELAMLLSEIAQSSVTERSSERR